MYTPNFDYKFSMAWAGTELCGLCLGIPGFKLIVGFARLPGVFALETPWHNLCFICLPMCFFDGI